MPIHQSRHFVGSRDGLVRLGYFASRSFDQDGFADLAIGVVEESVGRVRGAGAVDVLYGTAAGLTGSGSQLFTQNSPGVGSTAADSDFFGAALASGDFDHDGFADLAVGVSGEDIGTASAAGAVNARPQQLRAVAPVNTSRYYASYF